MSFPVYLDRNKASSVFFQRKTGDSKGILIYIQSPSTANDMQQCVVACQQEIKGPVCRKTNNFQ